MNYIMIVTSILKGPLPKAIMYREDITRKCRNTKNKILYTNTYYLTEVVIHSTHEGCDNIINCRRNNKYIH